MPSPYTRRKRPNIEDLLITPDKGISATKGVGGILARLFRQIFFDLNVGPQMYGSLMTAFLRDPRNGIANNRKDRSSAMGNYSKEFSKPFMTWKKLVEGLRLLQFEGEVELIIRGKSRRVGGITEHSTKFNLGDYTEINQLEENESDDK